MNDLKKISINQIKGISSAREKLFAGIDVYTIYDLLSYYPRAYENRGNVMKSDEVTDGETVSLIMEVVSPIVSARAKSKTSGRTLTVQHMVAADDTGAVKITFFNREFLKNTFKTGTKFRFYGQVVVKGTNITMNSPVFEPYSEEAELSSLVAVYPLTTGITQKLISSAVKYSLKHYCNDIVDTIMPEIKEKYGFVSLGEAISQIHFPDNEQKLESARRRLAFDELYNFYLGTMRLGNKDRNGRAYRIKYPDMKAFTEKLPFTLTLAQKHAIQDILVDVSGINHPDKESTQLKRFIAPSRRLVQGDVGSGKTIVACAAIYAAAKSGFQSALMVPTGILAVQHYEEMRKLLSQFGIRCCLLTGGMRITEKRRVIAELASGEADVVIGTHAIIEDDVVFKNLALAITDEQHRFGVMQRKALEEKGVFTDAKPHVVVMSATPIPRTLAMIVYCDLDISIIDQLPKGRKPVDTISADEDKRERIYDFIANLVNAGRQGYIVCPLAETDENDEMSVVNAELKSAKEYCESLSETSLKNCRIEYIHGKMKQDRKDDIMERFSKGEIDILVSTTVIEVGVNVPNACVMLIENAERFGLSQLHQLRGRVGRGTDKAYCILMSPYINKSKDSDFAKRIDVICKNTSGFVIAEKDLELRGPGEFFGKRQSGEFKFNIASLSCDIDLLQIAKNEAVSVIEKEM